ncbi:hypothetical protein ACOME3_008037 [Neoechinorhynchus agilis]
MNDLNHKIRIVDSNSKMFPSEFFDLTAQGLARSSAPGKIDRCVGTGQLGEICCDGGEIGFIKKQIKESFEHSSDRIRLFTSQVGRKASIKPLLKFINELCPSAWSRTSGYSQGRSYRWMLAWTFDLKNNSENMVDKWVCQLAGFVAIRRFDEDLNVMSSIRSAVQRFNAKAYATGNLSVDGARISVDCGERGGIAFEWIESKIAIRVSFQAEEDHKQLKQLAKSIYGAIVRECKWKRKREVSNTGPQT